MSTDPTVNVVTFRLRSIDGPVAVEGAAQAPDAVRKAWWKVILEHRPRAQDVVAVHSVWQPSPEDASFMQRTFVNATVGHDHDRPEADRWDEAFERARATPTARPADPAPSATPFDGDSGSPFSRRTRTASSAGGTPFDDRSADERSGGGSAAPVGGVLGGTDAPSTPSLGGRPRRTDPDWPFLYEDQAAWIRQRMAAALAERGVRTTQRGPVLLVNGTETVLPMDNLARMCNQAPESEWERIVDNHAALTATVGDGTAPRPDESAGRPVLRLMSDDGLPEEFAVGHARPVGDGLVETVALDLPDRVRILNDDDVAGADLSALLATARANLLTEPVEYQRFVDEGAVLHRVYGDSMFVASKALVLPELMREVAQLAPPAGGVLLALPSRHELLFHPVVDQTVIPALNELTRYARGLFEQSPGPLTPHVYWWDRGELTPLTNDVDSGGQEITIVIPPRFGEVLNRICG